jgi:hypothetical protein
MWCTNFFGFLRHLYGYRISVLARVLEWIWYLWLACLTKICPFIGVLIIVFSYMLFLDHSSRWAVWSMNHWLMVDDWSDTSGVLETIKGVRTKLWLARKLVIVVTNTCQFGCLELCFVWNIKFCIFEAPVYLFKWQNGFKTGNTPGHETKYLSWLVHHFLLSWSRKFFAIPAILKNAWIEIYGCVLALASSCMDACIVRSTGPRSKNTMGK